MVADAIKKYKCTVFTGVELMYNHLNNSTKSAKGYLRTIRACLSGAGPLYKAVQEKFEALTGGRVVEGTGSQKPRRSRTATRSSASAG